MSSWVCNNLQPHHRCLSQLGFKLLPLQSGNWLAMGHTFQPSLKPYHHLRQPILHFPGPRLMVPTHLHLPHYQVFPPKPSEKTSLLFSHYLIHYLPSAFHGLWRLPSAAHHPLWAYLLWDSKTVPHLVMDKNFAIFSNYLFTSIFNN